MTLPAGWDPDVAVANCVISRWRGSVWRAHKRKRTATDYGGTRFASGRWHVAQGDPAYVSGPTWPALYTSLDLAVCAFEVQRIIKQSGGSLEALRDYRYTELWAQLEMVIDCRDATHLGLASQDLLREQHFDVPRALAIAARRLSVEAMLVPSASEVGGNLIIFPDLRRDDSVLEVIQSLDPKLGI